jgi:hypothetical protein
MFSRQLDFIKNAMTHNVIILGDFNLDWSQKGAACYAMRNYFDEFELVLSDYRLTQMVNFPTWSRIVNNLPRSSITEHVYLQDPCMVSILTVTWPIFGDHLLIILNLDLMTPVITPTIRRDWRYFSKESLCTLLESKDWSAKPDSVQTFWDIIKNNLIQVVDAIVLLAFFVT